MERRAATGRIAVSALGYAEVHATFARRLRESLLTPEEHDALTDRFERDWLSVILVPVRPVVLAKVPELVNDHPLRGADAVHLASALVLLEAGLDLVFAVSDRRLGEAAMARGIPVFDPAEPGS